MTTHAIEDDAHHECGRESWAGSPRPSPQPPPNKGDTAWMLTSTALVLLMSVPALALFYGGPVRTKNMLSVLMQVFVGFSLITVLRCLYGYSLAFTQGNAIIGGFGKEPMAPHSLTMTMIGASLLWFGWFGFNAGSALEANGSAALAFMNTYLATAGAVLSWMSAEWLLKGKPSMGNVGIPGAFAIGLGVGVVCLWGVTGLKKLIRADDSLDVFGVHAVGGIFGALMTGIFNDPSLGGPGSTVDWVTGATG